MPDVNFSEKFQPLFEVLEAENVLATLKESDEEYTYWKELSEVSVVCISGGRESGKSFAKSCFEATAASQYRHRVLSTRYTMSSTDNSITSSLENRFELLRITGFKKNGSDYIFEDGGKVSITGQKTSAGNQTAKLKSLEDYSIFITDEAEELNSYEEWKKIKRSMRAHDVQNLSILVFNPPTKEHWIYETFYETVPEGFNGVKDGVLYIHTTYLDLGEENVAQHNWIEFEELRKHYEIYQNATESERDLLDDKTKRKHDEYKNRIIGAFKDKADGVIYSYWRLGEFDNSLPFVFGLDFGSNDPDALTRVAINHKSKTIYIKEEFFKNNVSTDGLFKILVDRCGYSNLIVADNAERRLIRDYYDKGINIDRCDKRAPVATQIKELIEYEIVVDPNSKNLIKAFNNYVWNDKKSGVPNHDYSDIMDSWRYGAWRLLNPSIGML